MHVAFKPDWRVAPGETLKEVMDERGWTIYQLCAGCHMGLGHLQSILDGVGRITPGVAACLHDGTGVSAEMWLALEAAYREPR